MPSPRLARKGRHRMYISRRSVLVGLCLSSLLFLAAQFYLLKWAGSPGIFSWSSLSRDTSHKGPTISPYRATKVFADAARKFEVPVFLIEPSCLTNISLLRAVDANNAYPGRCKYLCGSRNVTTFGVLNARLISDDFLKFLEEKVKITWMAFYGRDPRTTAATTAPIDGRGPTSSSSSSSSGSEIALHYLFAYGQQVVHLVVFYERGGSYLWHGRLARDPAHPWRASGRLSPFRNLDLTGLRFGGRDAGAYDKMEFTTTRADGVELRLPRRVDLFLDQVPFARFLECDDGRAAAFRAAHGRDESAEAAAFRQSARDVLEKGQRALDQMGVRFWLSSGTCLGWFRECDIIAHSKDVDFGMWIRDYKSSIIEEFDSRGLTLKHQFGKISDSFELSFQEDGLKLDIFFFYREKDHMWNGGTEVRSGNKFKYVFPVFTLCWAELLGLKVRVPCDTQRYIEANYGPEWTQKVTAWDWKSSPPNVRPNGQWDQAEWPQVIQVFPTIL